MTTIQWMTNQEATEIQDKIRHFLEQRGEILFAYLHGSFLEGDFRDIDIAVFLTERGKKEALEYELNLESELKDLTGFSADVRSLDHSPLSFRFNVMKNGVLLFSRDEAVRTDFECLSIVEYHDLDFHRKRYREEALGIKV
jgi:predicted nucleotidyltransferase